MADTLLQVSRPCMRHTFPIFLALAVLGFGCSAPRQTDFSPYYPATAALRQETIAHSVPTNAPFGSLYEVGIYLVQPGDTLEKIMDHFQVSEQQLRELNPMSPEVPSSYFKYLKVGQRLVIYERVRQ